MLHLDVLVRILKLQVVGQRIEIAKVILIGILQEVNLIKCDLLDTALHYFFGKRQFVCVAINIIVEQV